ncbi:MAG TPA: hypothetical protein ENH63_05645 [Sulfitobacter litoralis]|jgi:hypothetical protein|uniref:Uncharacterized protein n=3 Tax=root TaxID=1 RepID=A0A7V1A7N8_9RHOB|nr:hypothetical protein [Sulfitobacter litoralis]MBQ0716659.1 hypothetical protein [Sulfitobacter litoralis]MBQ0800698.1 hypothetical protein [Sulfitobacter litoralis]HDY96099.1 hypothetical protein [Sulfitobacter litoralis]HDZ51262.1 hypothetical protein [Sulfitobacter litoralis]|tara:strand:- start:371 stop:589 length:219 start_codon:yes stop_codon:yes gene_type:complete
MAEMKMTNTVQDQQTNILTFVPAVATWKCITVAQHFGSTPVVPAANENYAPQDHEGAQTRREMLDFLYRVAR